MAVVTLVTEDQRQDASANLIDTYIITFTAGPNATPFTVTIDQGPNAVADAQAAIDAKEQQVTSIYGI